MTIEEFIIENKPDMVYIKEKDYRGTNGPLPTQAFWDEFSGSDVVRGIPKKVTIQKTEEGKIIIFTLQGGNNEV